MRLTIVTAHLSFTVPLVVDEFAFIRVAVDHDQLSESATFAVLEDALVAISIWEDHHTRAVLDTILIFTFETRSVWRLFHAVTMREAIFELPVEGNAVRPRHLTVT